MSDHPRIHEVPAPRYTIGTEPAPDANGVADSGLVVGKTLRSVDGRVKDVPAEMAVTLVDWEGGNLRH